MFRSNGYEQVLECILVLTLDGKHSAQVDVIVLPENHIFSILKTMKNRLHGDDRERIRMLQMSCAIRLATRKCPAFMNRTNLQLLSPCHSSISVFLGNLRKPQHFSRNSYLKRAC